MRTHESTRKLARRVENGTARIRSATLSLQRGRWHVSLSVELPDPTPAEPTDGRVVGVDLGIKSLAVLSTGEVVPNPRHLDATLTALRRAQRRCSRRCGPDRRTRASFESPPVEMQQLLAAVAMDPLATEDFVSVQAGTMPVPEFFDPANVTCYLDGADALRAS